MKINGESLEVFTEASGAESTFGLTLFIARLSLERLVEAYKIEGFDPGSE